MSQIKSILKKDDRRKPIHFFLAKSIPRILNKTGLWLSLSIDNLTNSSLYPSGLAPASMLMQACNLRELWPVLNDNTHFHVLDPNQKSMLENEKALFKAFFENEPTHDTSSVQIVF